MDEKSDSVKGHYHDGKLIFRFDDILYVKQTEYETIIHFKNSEKSIIFSYRYDFKNMEKFIKEYEEYLKRKDSGGGG